jgi:hypothetical protein
VFPRRQIFTFFLFPRKCGIPPSDRPRNSRKTAWKGTCRGKRLFSPLERENVRFPGSGPGNGRNGTFFVPERNFPDLGVPDPDSWNSWSGLPFPGNFVPPRSVTVPVQISGILRSQVTSNEDYLPRILVSVNR